MTPSKTVRQIGWFILLWILGVGALGVVAYLIKLVIL